MKEMSLNELMYSIEKDKTEGNTLSSKQNFEGKTPKKSVFDTMKELPSKVSTLNKNSRMFLSNAKNVAFYKRYLGRVESGLYSRYGSEAEILENKMKDDPVKILTEEAKVYIQDVVKDLNKLYEEFLKMSKALEGKTTSEQCIKVITPYIKNKELGKTVSGKDAKNEENSWKKRIINSTKLRIAEIILRHGERSIYGYTAENMVLKKYPPPNHTMVTLFVENPEEHPQKQSVTDIFTSVESFKIIAQADKNDAFNISNMTRAVMEKTVDGKIINEIEGFKSNTLEAFKNMTKTDDNAKQEAKIIDSIWEGVIGSSKVLLSKKNYVILCINSYFDMILRINKLAVASIKSMLEVESQHTDRRYKTGISRADGNRTKEDKEEQRQKYQEQNDIIKNLNKRK